MGHLAWHEHRYWLELSQGVVLFPELNQRYAYGAPMFTPALSESWMRIEVSQARLAASVDLFKAIGGGWKDTAKQAG